MKILNIEVTGGPNLWSVKRPRLIVMLLDLEELEIKPTNEIIGFYHRIKKEFPGFYEHCCSEGKAGGFLTRVKEGTWMGHVVEHIALELQFLAGLDVSFGKTRSASANGQYYVVFDCLDEESGRLTAEKAVTIAQNLVDGNSNNIKVHVREIRETNARNMPGPSTASLLREAKARNIPYIKLDDFSAYQLGYGCHQKKIAATIASTTNCIAVDLASDKEACRQLFRNMLIPVAEGGVVSSCQELAALIDEIGYPLVVKPASGNQGRGVTTNITTFDAATAAFQSAFRISKKVIVEKFIRGHDFRLLTINHKLVAAAKRTPAHVTGDGKSTIRQLIYALNSDPRRGKGHSKVLTKITMGSDAKKILTKKGYNPTTVLPQGEVLYLNHAANLSKGGTAEDVTDRVHPDVEAMAERISRVVDLDICGIDLIAPTLEQPLSATGGAILEVNAAPGFRMHLSPSKGKPRNVAEPVLDMLFPKGAKSRIPVIAVTGTNGKTTVTRIIAHIMKEAGRRVGYTTTDGIYINGQLMRKGDCGGPKSAQSVLRDPTVDTAVLECARGGILRLGLGFDKCDIGVVTNVASDHLGMKGIDTLREMAQVKSVVPESVHPKGYAVLNADDDRVYEMRENLDCGIALFSRVKNNLRILNHRKSGGICTVYQNRRIIIWDGNKTWPVEKIENVPLSFNGQAGFMIENILAAVTAAYCQGVSISTIKQALNNFMPSPKQIPGRMNLFNFENYDVLIDYAHNPAGLMALKRFLDSLSYRKKTGILAAIGDRRIEDSIEMGRIAAGMFDEIIIREDADLRGRAPGETTEMIKQGIASSESNPTVIAIPNEKDALLFALQNPVPGSLVLLCSEQVEEIIAFLTGEQVFNFKKNGLPDTAAQLAPSDVI